MNLQVDVCEPRRLLAELLACKLGSMPGARVQLRPDPGELARRGTRGAARVIVAARGPAAVLLDPSNQAGRLLVITDEEDATATAQWLQRGALGVLPTSASAEDLVDAVNSVAEGQLWLPRRTAYAVLDALARRRMDGQARTGQLSNREQEVLRLLIRGHGPKESSERLGIARRTVEKHLANARRKLGAHSQVELAAIARELLG